MSLFFQARQRSERQATLKQAADKEMTQYPELKNHKIEDILC
jgi:hypothetical protein